jgi:hypothetical protein
MNEKFPLFLIEKRPGGSTHSSLEPAFPCGLLMVLREMSDTLTISIALPHGKSSFVCFKHLFSSDSVPVSPARPQLCSSALEQEKNIAYVREKEEDFS